MNKIQYNGSSKILKKLVDNVNELIDGGPGSTYTAGENIEISQDNEISFAPFNFVVDQTDNGVNIVYQYEDNT